MFNVLCGLDKIMDVEIELESDVEGGGDSGDNGATKAFESLVLTDEALAVVRVSRESRHVGCAERTCEPVDYDDGNGVGLKPCLTMSEHGSTAKPGPVRMRLPNQ